MIGPSRTDGKVNFLHTLLDEWLFQIVIAHHNEAIEIQVEAMVDYLKITVK